MKKILAYVLAAVLAMAALTGCQSPLSRGLARAEKQYGAVELDPSQVFSEEEGYHHPLFTWGKTLSEITSENFCTISEVMGASETGDISYKLSGMYLKLLGRWNDSTVVIVPNDQVCYLVSVVYSLGDKEDRQPISLKELYPQYLEKLTEAFGEPELEEEARTVESTRVNYVTNYWEYTRPDGKVTQLQWSAAYLSGSTAPSYITLGFTALPETEE